MNKIELLQALQEQTIPHKLVEHEPIHSVADGDRVNIENRDKVVRNLFLRDAKKRNYYVVTLNVHKSIDLKELATKLKSTRLSFANAEKMQEFLGVQPGSVTPFALINDVNNKVRLILDGTLANTLIGCHPLQNDATVFMDFEVIKEFIEQYHPVEVMVL